MLITRDAELVAAAREGFHPADTLEFYENWSDALDGSSGSDILFVDLIATLEEPHKIAGYEKFAETKMDHPVAKDVPVVVISPPEDYELDFMTGYPNFAIGNIRRPVSAKIFRRASTWV